MPSPRAALILAAVGAVRASPAPSPPPMPVGWAAAGLFVLQTSGWCATNISSASDCEAAAAALSLGQTSAFSALPKIEPGT